MNKLLAAVLALAAAAPLAAMGRKPPQEAKVEEWRGQFCSQPSAMAEVVETPARWETVWKTWIGKEPPAADFTRVSAVVVFLGFQPTGGYAVEFLDPVADASTSIVRYRMRKPAGFVIQAFTQPYAVKLYPKTGLKIQVAEAK